MNTLLYVRGLTVHKNHQFPNDPLKPLKAAPYSTSMCQLPENTAQPCAHLGRGHAGVFALAAAATCVLLLLVSKNSL